MTDQLDTRTTGTVTAFMDEIDHPLRRSTFTPAEGVPLAETFDEEPTVDEEPTLDEEPLVVDEPSDPDAPPVVDAQPFEGVSPADRGFPKPPERGSLDDEDLVPLVGRHTDDTATVDLIGILQAQMQLRATEAARFADWEAEIRRIGTDEALDELERTRLHFTGVIPIHTGPAILTTASAPTGSALVPERVEPARDHDDAPIIPTGTAPEAVPEADAVNPHVERARLADDELLERADESGAPVAGDTPSATHGIATTSLSILAILIVVASLIVLPLGAAAGVVAALSAVGVLAAAWLGLAVGRLALRGRSGIASPVTSRTTWAVVGGLVAGTAVGEGLVRTTSDAFSWQGYLLSLVQVHGFHVELSIVAGLVTACVIAFVVVVLVDRGRSGSTVGSAVRQEQLAD